MLSHNKDKSINATSKNNFKKGCKNDLLCRFCKKETETQEHILQTCPEIRERCGQTIEYKEIFQEDVEELKKAANFIIKTTEELSKAEEYKKKWRQRSRTAWAPPMGVSHPADPGKCKTTTTTWRQSLQAYHSGTSASTTYIRSC